MMKSGWKAMPKRPRSPLRSVATLRNGAGSSTPFLMTLTWPSCWQKKIRPSGANFIAVGELREPAITVSVKPDGGLPAKSKETQEKWASERITRAGRLVIVWHLHEVLVTLYVLEHS